MCYYSYTRVGLVVFALHDPADVFLNGAKVLKYFGFNKLCDATFVLFTAVWVATRMTLLPIVVNVCFQMQKVRCAAQYMLPGDFFEPVFLYILQVLHCYWTVLILRMAWRFVVVKGVEKDIRSDDE